MKVPLVDLKAQYASIGPEIDAAISRVISNTSFIRGPEAEAFESEFARWVGGTDSAGCSGTSSGTDALYLALRALGVGEGDEVITTPHTFIATAEAITLTGARPVFVDTDPDTFNICPKAAKRAVTERTRAVLVVHLFGQPADMEAFRDLAREHELFVVEDAAQAHGAEWRGTKTGVLGDAGCFSFFPGKNLGAYGDAGAVVSTDPEVTDRVRMLSNHGRLDKYRHRVEGVNSRMDGLQAAILRAKLPHLTDWINARREKAARYDDLLAEVEELELPVVRPDCDPAWHLYVVRLEARDECLESLKGQGVAAGIHYPIPLHLQPAYRHLGHRKGDFHHTERNADRILSLPIYPEITEEKQTFVVEALKDFFAGAKG